MEPIFTDQKKIWLPRLTTRLTLYFFYMSLTVFTLYILGNYQQFSDETQFFLFRLMKLFFYTFLCSSLANFILNGVITIRRSAHKGLFYFRFVLMTLLITTLFLSIHFLFNFFQEVLI